MACHIYIYIVINLMHQFNVNSCDNTIKITQLIMSPFSYFEVTCLATELNRMGSRDVFLTTELLLNWHCILKHGGHDMGHNGQRGQLMHRKTS